MILPDSIRISKRFLRSTGLRRIPCDLQLQNSQPNLMACLLIHFAGGTVTIDPPGRSNEVRRIKRGKRFKGKAAAAVKH
jgi:hypothetical protein